MVASVFTFRRLTRDDFALLSRWLAEPHVRRWWNHESSPEALEDDFGDAIDGLEPAEDYVVLLDGEPIGLMQYCRFRDYPEYIDDMEKAGYPVDTGAVSIDYFIGEPELVGRGLGTRMIEAFCERIWTTDPYASSIIVPVNSANVGSWRALQRAGFELAARGDMEPDNPIDGTQHEILRLDRP
jgi:aminoglycoside 6'-N-acetyltransferase